MKIFAFGILCLVWGSTWIAIKISLEGLPPLLGVGLRFAIAVVVLSGFIWAKRLPLKTGRKEMVFLFVTGLLTYTFNYGLIYWGEQYLSAGVTAIFFATFTLFVALGTHFVIKLETFKWSKLLGLLVGFGGVLVVFFDQLIITHFQSRVILAAGAIVTASAGGALGLLLVKKFLTKMNPYLLTYYQMIFGTVFLVFLGLMFEDIRQVRLDIRVSTAVLYLGVVGSAFAFVLYYRLLQQMSVITLSLIIYITPLVALLGDYLLFKEVPPLRSFFGAAIIFFGIWLTQAGRENLPPFFNRRKHYRPGKP